MAWLKKIRNFIIKSIYWKNIAYLFLIVSSFVIVALFFDSIMQSIGRAIQKYNTYVIWTLVITSAIGLTHALLKRTKEDNTFFLKFLNNPFIAAVFTAVTYGVMMNACLALLYIVLYDSKFMETYASIDKVTTGAALALLLMGSVTGLLKMLWEICKPPETTVSTSPPNSNDDESTPKP